MEHAAECRERKFNCAESVLRGICYALDIELTDQTKMAATPFGGGIGRSEDVCGALAGGVLALGVALGRTEPNQDRFRSYDAALALQRSFVERFGSSQCRTLNRSDFQLLEHRIRCAGFVRESCRLAIEIARARK